MTEQHTTSSSDDTRGELTVFVRFHAAPGREHEVAALIGEVIGPTSVEPGNKSIHGYCSVRDSCEFYIHSCWHSEAAFDRHAELDHTVRFLSAVEPLLDQERRISRTMPIT